MTSYWTIQNRWTISGTLHIETALSIGSQSQLLPSVSDLPVLKTKEGIPFIPGSSLKGVFRFRFEQMMRTFQSLQITYSDTPLWACDPLSERERCVIGKCCEQCSRCSSPCCDQCQKCKTCMVQRASQKGYFDDLNFTQELWQQSCTACRLFGSPWMASRIYFQDSLMENTEELPLWIEVRDGIGIDRDLGIAKEGIKFDFEVVPQGARFPIYIQLENVEDWEVGLILSLLQEWKEGKIPIGGKTSRGLGWGKLKKVTLEKLSQKNLLPYLTGKVKPDSFSLEEGIQNFFPFGGNG